MKSAGFSMSGFIIGATILLRRSWKASLSGCTFTPRIRSYSMSTLERSVDTFTPPSSAST
jgi:hypothetical protein